MPQKTLYQGAEAIIYQKENTIIKDRTVKSYRLKQLDDKIRIQRTRRETKLLIRASELINCPKPIKPTEPTKTKIKMPFIDGKKLSEHLDKLQSNQQKQTCEQIGKSIAKLHDNDIIHGDLTTSNIILSKQNNQVWLIDFGLGFQSPRIEDKAVDLHLIKQALEAKHFENWKQHYKNILKGYKSSKNYKKTLGQLEKVEARGRYKGK